MVLEQWMGKNKLSLREIYLVLTKKECTCAFIFSCRMLIIMSYVSDKLRRLCINKNMIYQ